MWADTNVMVNAVDQIAKITKPRHETRRSLLGCTKPPITDLGCSPYCEDMWRRYCCLTGCFRLSIHALVAKMRRCRILRPVFFSEPRAARFRPAS